MPENLTNLPPIESEYPDHVTFRVTDPSSWNYTIDITADEALARGAFKILFPGNTEPYVAWIMDTVAIGEICRADISEGWEYNIPASEIADGSTFVTQWADVWYDDVNHTFHSAAAAGLYLVGKVSVVQNAEGLFRLMKRRYAVLVEGT